MIHSTEKNLTEHGDKLPADDKTVIETDMAALREATEADDIEQINQKTQALSQSSMKLGEAIYKAEQTETTAGPGPGDGDGAAGGTASPDSHDEDANVVDADFEEVDDDKKGQSPSP